jgi:hypothetical protein
MKKEMTAEQKAKKAAYDKEYRAREKFSAEIEKTEKFIASCEKKFVEKINKSYSMLSIKMTNIATEAGKTNNPIELEKLSLEYMDLLEKLIEVDHQRFGTDVHQGSERTMKSLNRRVIIDMNQKFEKSLDLPPIDKYSLFASIFNNR